MSGLFSQLLGGAKKNASPDQVPVSPSATEPQPPADSSVPSTFDAEFGNIEFETAKNDAPHTETTASEERIADAQPLEATVGHDSGDLEEWSEPLGEAAIEPLPPGALLDFEGAQIQVVELQQSRGGVNVYRAAMTPVVDANSEAALPLATLRLCETDANADSALRLKREATLRSEVSTLMIPRAVACFEQNDRAYLAVEEAASQTLESLLAGGAPLGDVLHVLVQVAAALGQLHAAGWVHLGLRPDGVLVGKPVQLGDFSFAQKIGETLQRPVSHAGYSAPELHMGTHIVADPRADIYAMGALLYRAVAGEPIPESGADLTTWSPQCLVAGVPQILQRCLDQIESRYTAMADLHRDLMRLKSRLRPSTNYAVAAATTIGLEPTRTTNQDAWACLKGTMQSEAAGTAWAMCCVADGMGGMAAGEVASEAAVVRIQEMAAALAQKRALPSASEQAQLLKQWAEAANQNVCEALTQRGARGGCTLAAILAVERNLAIAYAGDCRIYLLRGGECHLISRDHSFVMALVLQGEISVDEIRTHSDRNKVTRSLGDRHPLPEYFIDTLEATTGTATLEMEANDIVLLCSDGLWEPVLENEMLQAVREYPHDLNAAAQQMIEIALARGASDNATVTLLRLENTPPHVSRATAPKSPNVSTQVEAREK